MPDLQHLTHPKPMSYKPRHRRRRHAFLDVPAIRGEGLRELGDDDGVDDLLLVLADVRVDPHALRAHRDGGGAAAERGRRWDAVPVEDLHGRLAVGESSPGGNHHGIRHLSACWFCRQRPIDLPPVAVNGRWGLGIVSLPVTRLCGEHELWED